MKKNIDLNNWKRKDLYSHYDICTNPFIIVSTEIDITNLYNYVKKNKLSMYASIGYYILNTANEFEGFKYRKENNNLVLYDKVNANFTDSFNGGDIFFFSVKLNNDLKEFNINYRNTKDDYIKNNREYIEKEYRNDEIWFSCVPWFSFVTITPPYNHDNYIPQFIWDKFKHNKNKVTTNVMVMIHHGFMDGYQLGQFFTKLQENINKNIN